MDVVSASRRAARIRFCIGCSLAALALAVTAPQARAQNNASPAAPQSAPDRQNTELPPSDRNIIIVNGQRVTVTVSEDEPAEQSYDSDAIAAYAASTLGEVVAQIREQNGDTDPVLLVNGQPVADPDDIADLPVEAVARIETLPRGSAQRVGGNAGQRAYNVVLRSSVRSLTLTGGREMATEGGWSNTRGEALLTYIRGRDRINLTLRGGKSGTLFESERAFIPRALAIPYSPLGNLMPASGSEIDPALSALVGVPVGVAALPANNSSPSLADLAAGANRPNPAADAAYRSLRGSNRPIELALSGNKELAPWLSLSFNGRLNWSVNENFSGLPTGRFLIPALHPLTPFDSAASLALSDASRPLRGENKSNFRSLSATLNANKGDWRATLSGRWDERHYVYVSRFSGPLTGGANIVPATVNPFDGSLAALIPISERQSRSRGRTGALILDSEGPIADLWAGPLRVRAGVGASWTRYRAEDFSGLRSLDRHEYSGRLGITIPLTSSTGPFLPDLGDSEVALDIGRTDLGRFGSLKRYSLAFNWQPAAWLRIVASDGRDDRAIVPELLSAPVVITPNVPYFDPVTGDTVDVTAIYGGGGNLRNEQQRTRSVALTLTPLSQYGLQLDAEYSRNDLRNQIGALPPPSAAIVAAFPDRFQRDANGTLVLVDNRSVNFARQRSEQLRFGLRLAMPLSGATPAPATGALPRPSGPRALPLRLQVNLSHILLLNNRTIIRDGLPEIDLLKGGAIGLSGGQQRHFTTGSIALTQGNGGVRIEAQRRGASQLVIGSLADPDLLAFGALTTVDLKAFADLGQAFPKAKALKDLRLTVAFDNLFNNRQRVTNLVGETPQAYQPVRRDPIGRTLLFELRKVF
ncbi:MAG: hypothetical protein J7499_15230 [Sphingopyxis sp.]|nr:hypothetical protein [Sphingopyxis sp.]